MNKYESILDNTFLDPLIIKYALKHHIDDHITIASLENDFNLFVRIKKALSRYNNTNKINIGLVLNTLVSLINIFGEKPVVDIILYIIPPELYKVIMPFFDILDINLYTEYQIERDSVIEKRIKQYLLGDD